MIWQERENQLRQAQQEKEIILRKVEPDLQLVNEELIKPVINKIAERENIEDLETAINRLDSRCDD